RAGLGNAEPRTSRTATRSAAHATFGFQEGRLPPDRDPTVPADGLPTSARGEMATFRLPAMSRARTTANAASPTRCEPIACNPPTPLALRQTLSILRCCEKI